MVTKYRPIVDLCEELFGVRPSHATVSRYAHHERGGKRLHVVKAGGRLLTTEESLLAYLSLDSRCEPNPAQRSISESAAAKAHAAAELKLEEEGI